jgi:hypothetical protein
MRTIELFQFSTILSACVASKLPSTAVRPLILQSSYSGDGTTPSLRLQERLRNIQPALETIRHRDRLIMAATNPQIRGVHDQIPPTRGKIFILLRTLLGRSAHFGRDLSMVQIDHESMERSSYR